MIRSLLFLHILFTCLWVGGMIFTIFFLRPSLRELTDTAKRGLLTSLYGKFFAGVWLAILLLFLTGMAMWHGYRRDFFSNTLFHVKLFLFGIMVIIFSYIYFFLYRKGRFNAIPPLVGVNLFLAVLILLIIVYIR
ncbi:integral membrane protein-like protein [Thermocrinis albus DSM 14484]|uniref:Integral membrane protein-like protein n=1 Tax=Thermocrinis albus (strain DSM 14484 / JCM 11386 / HI 11/12) TaxID=638303 RepID=D3SPL4_THEAH|nr:hypothetical protein [Thermocrinis albus]ADC89101.1 integral membrane protein-like protein [Thermocrinis albus DSM 14484]